MNGKKIKEEMSDHDRLIRMDERLSNLCTHFANHILHHWAISMSLLVIIAGLIITLLIK